MAAFTSSYDEVSNARSTTLLVSIDLGDYPVDETARTTTVLPSVVAIPAEGDGPTIIAMHPVTPIPGEMENWRSDLQWVTDACSSGNAAVGTWPSAVPALLGTPIDHVMSTPNWLATGMRVIETQDDSGSDHRPIVVQLSPGG